MPNGKETRKIIEVSPSEERLIMFCRRYRFFKCELIVLNGEPQKIIAPLRSIRLDLDEEPKLSTDEDIDSEKK
jgi:DNA polymerase III delta prime subunit